VSTGPGGAGSLIVLDGTLNLRDLGGWPVRAGGHTSYGRLYRSDRLSDLSDRDHRRLAARGIVAVVDLRFEVEVAAHPSRLWPTVAAHHEIPMGGDLANQRSLVEQVLAGELEAVTAADVADSYIQLLTQHAGGFGRAIEALLGDGPGLFHCSGGKDRTGLLSMLILSTVGVGTADVLRDFELSNQYLAERHISDLRPTFEAAGIDIERFRPALTAPRSAMERAMAWLADGFGDAEGFLDEAGGTFGAGPRLRNLLVSHDRPAKGTSRRR
jgi:protein-tyrosine phosphatase